MKSPVSPFKNASTGRSIGRRPTRGKGRRSKRARTVELRILRQPWWLVSRSRYGTRGTVVFLVLVLVGLLALARRAAGGGGEPPAPANGAQTANTQQTDQSVPAI